VLLQIASVFLSAGLRVATALGLTTSVIILVASFLFGTTLAFGMPVFQAIVPDLVPRTGSISGGRPKCIGEGAAPGWGTLSTPPRSASSGRIVIAKAVNPTRRRLTKCQHSTRLKKSCGVNQLTRTNRQRDQDDIAGLALIRVRTHLAEP
jgi:hypothetical protein